MFWPAGRQSGIVNGYNVSATAVRGSLPVGASHGPGQARMGGMLTCADLNQLKHVSSASWAFWRLKNAI